MKFAILIVSLLLLNSFLNAQDDDFQQMKKSQQLRQLASKDPSGIIKLTFKQYQYYVLDFPRPYDFVIFFTASNCQFCEDLYKEFVLVSEFYKESGALNPYKDEKNQKRAVFYGQISFSDDFREVFLDLDFKSVPNLLVSLPKTAIISNKEERQTYLKGFKWQITHTDGHVTSHKMLEYINKRTGRNVEHKVSITDAMSVIGTLFAAAAFFYIIFKQFRPFFLNTKVWFFGSIIIYTVCMSGVVYNIIHNIPFTTVDRNGQTEWISNQNRMQLGAEGVIMSGAISLAGVLFVIISRLTHISGHGSVNRLIYIALFAFVVLVIFGIEDVYKKKGWYNPRFYPPENYVQGPLMKDQGNTI